MVLTGDGRRLTVDSVQQGRGGSIAVQIGKMEMGLRWASMRWLTRLLPLCKTWYELNVNTAVMRLLQFQRWSCLLLKQSEAQKADRYVPCIPLEWPKERLVNGGTSCARVCEGQRRIWGAKLT